MTDKELFEDIENIKKQYNLEEGDPLFAFLEIQIKILKEIKRSNDASILTQQTVDVVNMFSNFKNEFQLVSMDKKREIEEDLSSFRNKIKEINTQELEDYKIELKNSLLLENKKSKFKPIINWISISLNIFLVFILLSIFVF